MIMDLLSSLPTETFLVVNWPCVDDKGSHWFWCWCRLSPAPCLTSDHSTGMRSDPSWLSFLTRFDLFFHYVRPDLPTGILNMHFDLGLTVTSVRATALVSLLESCKMSPTGQQLLMLTLFLYDGWWSCWKATYKYKINIKNYLNFGKK